MITEKFKILIIEDEHSVRESYKDMLEFLGYESDSAENGVEGLKMLDKYKYDIVITDLNMPLLDGLETLKRVKKKQPNVEVIVVTGFATIENAIEAMKHGAFDYITKPVSIEHVKIVLGRCANHLKANLENIELKNLNETLKHVNEIKDKFITITNHELRTPLAVLKGYVELLELNLKERSDENEEYIQIIQTTINEMIGLVERMHNLSQSEKILQKTSKERININAVILEVSREMRILFDKRKIKLKAHSNEKDIFIEGEYDAFKRVFRELLQNALKFTGSTGKVTININNEPNDQKVYISIEDTGVGIPNDQINLIFEPFYEVQDVMHHSTSQTDFMGGGIGVGLCIVNDIVNSVKGEIVVQSEVGKGSTFTIILPTVAEVETVDF